MNLWRHRVALVSTAGLLCGASIVASACGQTSTALPFTVSAQVDGVQITNDQWDRWRDCVVIVDGAYSARIVEPITAGGTARVPFRDLMKDGLAMPAGEGVMRAKRSMRITCVGEDGKPATSTFR